MKPLYILIEHQMIIGCITLRQDWNPDAQPQKSPLLKQTAKTKAPQKPKVKLVEKKDATPRPKEKAMPRPPPEPAHPPKRAKQDPSVLSAGMHIGKEAIYGHTDTHTQTRIQIYK